MSGNAEGGGGEMDRDTDREEDRRRNHPLLSIELLVTNDSDKSSVG